MTEIIQPYTAPVLLNSVIQQLQDQLQQLTWLEEVYPLVQVGQRRNVTKENVARGRTSFRYPQVYRNDGDTYQVFISPDRARKSFAFFEINEPYGIELNNPYGQSGQNTFNLNIVVWLNLPKIDSLRNYDFTEELIQDFIQQGLLGGNPPWSCPTGTRPLNTGAVGQAVTSLTVERRQELIFNRYDYSIAEEQFLIFPYSGFKVNLTLNSSYTGYCVPQWETLPL